MPARIFQISLAARIAEAYKEAVSSKSHGGLHDSTGPRSATSLNTPRTRCESRLNREQLELLITRRSNKGKGPRLSRGPFSFQLKSR